MNGSTQVCLRRTPEQIFGQHTVEVRDGPYLVQSFKREARRNQFNAIGERIHLPMTAWTAGIVCLQISTKYLQNVHHIIEISVQLSSIEAINEILVT